MVGLFLSPQAWREEANIKRFNFLCPQILAGNYIYIDEFLSLLVFLPRRIIGSCIANLECYIRVADGDNRYLAMNLLGLLQWKLYGEYFNTELFFSRLNISLISNFAQACALHNLSLFYRSVGRNEDCEECISTILSFNLLGSHQHIRAAAWFVYAKLMFDLNFNDRAIEFYQNAQNLGHFPACIVLGDQFCNRYAQDASDESSYAAAKKCYRMACKNNDARGMFALARLYRMKDPSCDVTALLLKAARGGSGDARYELIRDQVSQAAEQSRQLRKDLNALYDSPLPRPSLPGEAALSLVPFN